MKGGRVRRKIRQQPFPYPVFGRFAYRASALYGHCLCNWGGDGLVLRLCPSISDALYANSRTLDIGKVCCLILRRTLFLGAVVLGRWECGGRGCWNGEDKLLIAYIYCVRGCKIL